MERVLSPEERIRRAEDLYYRRKVQSVNRQTARVNVDNKSGYNSSKKFIKQMIACIFIYVAWYGIQNSNYIFSENITSSVKQLLEYDISLSSLYSIINTEEEQDNYTEDVQSEATIETSTIAVEETLSASEEVTNISVTTPEVIEPEVVEIIEEASSIDQMKEDAEYIKANYKMVKPLSGTITSRFGVRDSENPIVTSYHTGLDIAVNEGTVFVSAMSGTVELVSSVGDYGNHFKITNGDVSTIYAHCKTVYVKEGQQIEAGEEVAEVGSTGNSTGPHLHFEIRRNNQYVNPELVLDF